MKGHRQPLDDTPICYDATLNPRRQAIAVCSPQCSFQGGYILGLLAGKFYDSPPLVNVKFYSKIKSGSSTVFRMFLSDLTHGVMVETTPKSHIGARVLDYDVCEFVARITSVDRLEEPSSW